MILKLAAQVGIGIQNRDRFFPADKIIIHLCFFFCIKIGSIDRYITGAVSYTHLDVYKRQTYGNQAVDTASENRTHDESA